MWNKIKIGFKWLVFSSSNPDKISRTIKGAGLTLITVLVSLSPLTHLQWSTPELTALLDASIITINSGLAFVAAIWTTYGLLRKTVLTIEGLNKTLQ